MTTSDLSSLKINRDDVPSSQPSRKKPLYIIVTVIAVAVVGLFAFRAFSSPKHEVSLTSVRYATAGSLSGGLTASGYIIPQRKAAVASKGTGRLVYLGVVEGDTVRAGQVIARLEDNDIRARLAQAAASLELSKAQLLQDEAEEHRLGKEYTRMQNLFKAGSIPETNLDRAESEHLVAKAKVEAANANVRAAQAAYRAAEVELDNTRITAPFAGTILTKGADIGEIVAPFAGSINAKSAVVTMADMSSLQLEADVSESNIERISIGQPCEIVLDAYPQVRYPGIVEKIVPTANRNKATILTKVRFLEIDSRVLPEMSAKTTFLSKASAESMKKSQPKLVVPTAAIVAENGKKSVFTVEKEALVAIPVTVGSAIGLESEVLSGLNAGQQIVANTTSEMHAGDKVEIKK
ncbi:MAG: efflux RND transporter periplasmic adaptor subunit [Chlorobiales bacterium]|nr:efflux RND transporter periplasmic adaptor subunit [Chlorobiales bacterium]